MSVISSAEVTFDLDRDYYYVLGVSASAPKSVIEVAYKEKLKGATGWAEKHALKEAWKVLGDTTARLQYNDARPDISSPLALVYPDEVQIYLDMISARAAKDEIKGRYEILNIIRQVNHVLQTYEGEVPEWVSLAAEEVREVIGASMKRQKISFGFECLNLLSF